MKLLTLNFLTCAHKPCRAASSTTQLLHLTSPESLPLTITHVPQPFNPLLLRNLLPRIDWESLRGTAAEDIYQDAGWAKLTSFPFKAGLSLPVAEKPEFLPPVEPTTTRTSSSPSPSTSEDDAMEAEPMAQSTEEQSEPGQDEDLLKAIHKILLETVIQQGGLRCERCGHEYKVMEGIANFLLPAHMGESFDVECGVLLSK
ncbi:MAG: hypothetical protein M1833_007225 [Piccolia ochrophora]|nr:MAG: hypothetical protein M1833_007225 [Piccolia ochrophora]